MQFLEEEILEITEATWQSILGLDIRPRTLPASIDVTEGSLIGKVEVSGAWNGAVVLLGSRKLAQAAAAVIFAHESGEATDQDAVDAMYELTNIIGGNIKSLLPEPCQLSLPSVETMNDAEVQMPEMERVSEFMFDCQNEPLLVSVWKRQDG